MDANDPSTTFVTLTHGLGVKPIMTEVQVMSPTTGFIYPGVKSAYAGNDAGERGGVICIYDDTNIRLYGATNENTGGGQAYIVYTGRNSWTQFNQEYSTTGYVRVRVWVPADLPTPDFTTTLNMKAGNYIWNHYETRTHGLGTSPVLTVVQYEPAWTVALSGWTAEAQGSSSRPVDNAALYWGGLVYAVDGQDIRMWASNNDQANYGIFSVCDGWGYAVPLSDCSYIRCAITIYMWTDLGATETFSTSGSHDVTSNLLHEYPTAVSIDSDNDIVTAYVIAKDGENAGFRFPGTGAAMVDDMAGCGGLVYAYSNASHAVRVWHPVVTSSYLVHVHNMGAGVMNQLSTQGDVAISVYKPFTSSFPPCHNVVVENTANASLTLSGASGECVATYVCNPGYSHVGGTLTRVYEPVTGTWKDVIPSCQEVTTTTPVAGTTTEVFSTTSEVETTTSNTGTTTELYLTQCFNVTTYINMTEVLAIAEEIVANLTVNSKTTSNICS